MKRRKPNSQFNNNIYGRQFEEINNSKGTEIMNKLLFGEQALMTQNNEKKKDFIESMLDQAFRESLAKGFYGQVGFL